MKNTSFVIKKNSVLLVIFITLQTVILSAQSQASLRTPKFQRVETAYAYIMQTENYFKLLYASHPKLQSEIEKSKALFSSSYGIAKVNMKQYLIDFYGKEKFQIFENGFSDILNENLSDLLSDMSTEHAAYQIIELINKRSNGDVPPETLRTILHFQFLEKPLLEFTKGYTYTFKTKNHQKSKGTDWQLNIPYSWLAEEGNRPNIIQKFTSDVGDGFQMIMLMVYDLPSEYKNLTEDEIDQQFDETDFESILPEDATLLSFNKITIEGCKGGMLIFEKTGERLDIKMEMQICLFFFVKDRQNYQIMCTVSSDDNNKDLTKEMEKFLLLFKSVANTIVLNSKYNVNSQSGTHILNAQQAKLNLEAKEDDATIQPTQDKNALTNLNLGQMYYFGYGVDIDKGKAFTYYYKAAEQGDPIAQYSLGVMYFEGDGVYQNLSQSAFWYEKAAQQGHNNARCNLASMYYLGQGVKQDYQKSLYWNKMAANEGDAEAQSNLGYLYYNGEGTSKDNDKAFYWYLLSGKQGNSDAQYFLGILYFTGEGVIKDLSKGFYWTSKSANQGHILAQYNLGLCYNNGNGIEKDLSKAFIWFTKAANQGNPISQFNIALMYYYGKGTAVDKSKASYWCKKASNNGEDQATQMWTDLQLWKY